MQPQGGQPGVVYVPQVQANGQTVYVPQYQQPPGAPQPMYAQTPQQPVYAPQGNAHNMQGNKPPGQPMYNDAGPQGAITGKQPPPFSGRRKALMVGCNYPGTSAELNGCINDVHNLTKLLTQTFGWDQSQIRTLTGEFLSLCYFYWCLIRGAKRTDH